MIILYTLLLWAIVATFIFLSRKWHRKGTLQDFFTKSLFCFAINFFLCPICVYFNLKYVFKKLKNVKILKKPHKCSPSLSLLTQPVR